MGIPDFNTKCACREQPVEGRKAGDVIPGGLATPQWKEYEIKLPKEK